MKKLILIITIILILFFVYNNEKVDAEVVIPDGAIRVRVIANSNTIYDQSMKMKVKSYIEDNLSVLLLGVDSVEEARNIINDNLNSLNDGVENMFFNNDYDVDFKINFGDNYFPDKEYKGVVYDEGVYESLVVTIGEGVGDNWWCVLIPPLCLLETSEEEVSDIEKKVEETISTSKFEYNIELKKIRLLEIEKELEKYQTLLNELLIDYKNDFITQDDYDSFKQQYLYEINKFNIEKENLIKDKLNSYNIEWLNHFKKIGKFEKLDRNVVESFIKNIIVDNDRKIEIIFRYNEQYKFLERYLKNPNDVI